MREWQLLAVMILLPGAAYGAEPELPPTPLHDARAAITSALVKAGEQSTNVSVPEGFAASDCLQCSSSVGEVIEIQSTSSRNVRIVLAEPAPQDTSITAFFWQPEQAAQDGTLQYFVSPSGKADHDGTRERPWDLRSALDGTQTVPPGALIWFEAGTYSDPGGPHGLDRSYLVSLSGAERQPIHIAPLPGDEVTILGGFRIESDGWLWIGGFNFRNDDPPPGGEPTPPGTIPTPLPEGFDEWGGAGIAVMSGRNHVIYNNVTSGGSHAYSAWNAAPQTLFLGNIAYNAGWVGEDRAHGHCLYAQNAPGTGKKWLRHNLFEIRSRDIDGNYGLHLYVKSTPLAGFNVYQNAIRGPVTVQSGQYCEQLELRDNFFASARPGATAATDSKGNSFGKPGKPDGSITFRNNTLVNGAKRLENNDWAEIDAAGNRVIKTDDAWWTSDIGQPPAHARLESGQFVDATSGAPDEFVVWPNEIDLTRAHIVAVDLDRDGVVSVDLSEFLDPGDTYRLHHFKQTTGQPQIAGAFTGDSVPVSIAVPGDVVDMFVLFHDQ